MKLFKSLGAIFLLLTTMSANAILLVQTSDPGFYNNSIGTLLNSTNGGETGPFPISNDASLTFPFAPDLSTASGALGNWLTDPGNLNSNWSSLPSIPNGWTVGTEVAVIYQFNTLGATNVVAQFGVDNGIFAWLDGNYLGGARRGGGVSLGEHTFNIGDLAAGTHYLQLLLEDHGTTNGYAVAINADTFIPCGQPGSPDCPEPPPTGVPVPSTLLLMVLGLAGLGPRSLRKRLCD
jgi:hypothetical protein